MSIEKMLEQGKVTGEMLEAWQQRSDQEGLRKRFRTCEIRSYILVLLLIVSGYLAVPILPIMLQVIAVCMIGILITYSPVIERLGRDFRTELKMLHKVLFSDHGLVISYRLSHQGVAERARYHLVFLIAQYRAYEVICNHMSDRHISSEITTDRIKELHQLYYRFGLVEKKYDRYWHEAEKVLKEHFGG